MYTPRLTETGLAEFSDYFGINFSKKIKPLKRKTGKKLFIADTHFPYHHKSLFDKTINDNLDADELNILGDEFDMLSWSHWRKTSTINPVLEFREAFKVLKDTCELFPQVNIMLANHDCFDPETEILTKEGWMRYNEIHLRSDLATYNIEKEVIEYQQPTEIYRDLYDGEFYYLKSEQIDLATTPNHRYYYRPFTDKQFEEKWRLKSAEKIHFGNNRLYFKVAGGMNVPAIDIDTNIIKLVGWLLTDGSLVWRGNSPSIMFFQAESKVHLITDILDELGWKYNKMGRDTNNTHICGKELKSIQKSYIIYLPTRYGHILTEHIKSKKTIPEWVYDLSQEQFEVFLSSVIDGDGSRKKRTDGGEPTALMVYGIKKFLDQLQHACFIHGYRSFLTEYREGDWRLNITKNTIACIDNSVEHLEKRNYRGIIWCATVPNGTLIVRRKGKAVITGNSRFVKWLYDNVPNQCLQFTHYYIIEELLSTIPNLTVLSQKADNREINYIHQYKNIVFTHVEKSNIDITKTAQEIDKLIKHKWEHFLNIKDYDILMQAHNHSAGMVWVNNRLIIQIPCLIDISKPSFDYVFNGKMAGNPPAIGYITGYETKGKIEPNSIHLTKLA